MCSTFLLAATGGRDQRHAIPALGPLLLVKGDYVKWMLDDPRVNFAISTRPGRPAGISHLGIQAEDEAELAEVYDRLSRAERPIIEAKNATCCYAKSEGPTRR